MAPDSKKLMLSDENTLLMLGGVNIVLQEAQQGLISPQYIVHQNDKFCSSFSFKNTPNLKCLLFSGDSVPQLQDLSLST